MLTSQPTTTSVAAELRSDLNDATTMMRLVASMIQFGHSRDVMLLAANRMECLCEEIDSRLRELFAYQDRPPQGAPRIELMS